MATDKQALGFWGEQLVSKKCRCPGCKRVGTLKRLPQNFKCADLICDFCGFLAQVKTATVRSDETPPKTVLGAAWKPQKERMDAGIYFPLYLVLKGIDGASVYFLSTDFQVPDLFVPRKELSANARRAGWQGVIYDFSKIPAGALMKVFDSRQP